MKEKKTKTSGFTFVELLVTLLIVGVLLVVAIPITQDILLKKNVKSRAETLASALQYANDESAALKQTLTLAPKNGNWSSGLVLFLDTNHDHQRNSTESLIYEWKWPSNNILISWSGIYADYLLFAPNQDNSDLAGTFSICPLNSRYVATENVVMNRLGRVRVEESSQTCHT